MNTILLFFQGEGGSSNVSSITSIIWLVAPIALIFYFMVIRPQQKQQKETQEMVAELKINDEVVTNGGIIGKIKEVRDTSFIIHSADKSFLEVARTAVIGKRAEKTEK